MQPDGDGQMPENINLALSLVESHKLIPATFFAMPEGEYEFREDRWWFRPGQGPLWWRYPDAESLSKAWDEYDKVRAPWEMLPEGSGWWDGFTERGGLNAAMHIVKDAIEFEPAIAEKLRPEKA